MHLRNSFISTTRCDDLARATEAQDGKKKNYRLGRAFLRLRRFFPAASKMHFFCYKGAFVLLQGVFSAALNFSRCEAAFFAGVFSHCGNSFFLLQGVFFLLPNMFLSVPMFFPSRRVLHWAFATCKLDSAWTNR